MYGWPYTEMDDGDRRFDDDEHDAEQAEAEALADRLADHAPPPARPAPVRDDPSAP